MYISTKIQGSFLTDTIQLVRQKRNHSLNSDHLNPKPSFMLFITTCCFCTFCVLLLRITKSSRGSRKSWYKFSGLKSHLRSAIIFKLKNNLIQ